jgi:putative membrane protein
MLDGLRLVLVGLVAIEHLYILYLEMFAWTTPRVQRIFGTTPQFARDSKALAANQGLYNGFLAAGLLWSLLHPDAAFAAQLQLFFLGCVIVAAIYGGLTAKRSILLVQGGPALLALLVVLAAGV